MNDGELVRDDPALHGEVLDTDEDYLRAVYANSGIEDSLMRYLDTGLIEDSDDVEERLARFCNVIAATTLEDGEVDVDTVRSAFELFTDNMNEVASRKHGYKRQFGLQALLVRAGIKLPPLDSYVRHLDDRYWSRQFMDQYENGGMPMPPRQAEETDQEYLARYTFMSMRGLLFAPFTCAVG